MYDNIYLRTPDKLGVCLSENIDVFIDGRADLYSKYNLDDYSKISTLNGDYVELIKKYDFDYFLVMNNYPINTYLKYSQEYEEVLNEKNMILYRKKDSN